MIYPWFESVITNLDKALKANRLSHALLFQAKSGSGIEALLVELAKGLTCNANDSLVACNNCRDCQLWNSQQVHPDVFEIAKDDAVIRVDAIRALKSRVYLTSYSKVGVNQKGKRIIIIEKLQRLNEASANALLKLLEEPPENTFFLLETDYIDQLLPTIASRCEKIVVHITLDDTVKWLQSQGQLINTDIDVSALWLMAYGKPLVIRKLIEDTSQLQLRDQLISLLLSRKQLFDFIQSIKDDQFEIIVFWLYTLITDIIKLKLSAFDAIIHKDCIEQIEMASKFYSYDVLMSCYQKLNQLNEAIYKGFHLNKTLWLEDWFNYELKTH
ncbi:MAG: hypothetical protein EP298_01185 [Gammaproteobacteria bacterium]|nr:MAG: hypothetical protein EP298_01185 [Gammaproteobacteria bacterium]UTW41965.1 hypothetical protein KFE69_10695 [bacterium SCSIO 12844]